jgi:hypothetical protein
MTRPAALATRPRPKVPRGKPVRWQPARIKHRKKAAPLNMAASLQHPVYWLSVPRGVAFGRLRSGPAWPGLLLGRNSSLTSQGVSQNRPAGCALCPPYLEVLQLLARTKLRHQPARLLSSARPSLATVFRIPIFGQDFRIRTPRAMNTRGRRADRAKPIFQPSLLRCDPGSQQR